MLSIYHKNSETGLTINECPEILHLLNIVVGRPTHTDMSHNVLAKASKNFRMLREDIDRHSEREGGLSSLA